MPLVKIPFFTFFVLLLFSCEETNNAEILPIDPEVKEHWYDGKAEITTYKLSQGRYGEIHEGSAVMVFVTETFSKSSWTKADEPKDEDIPVMKLNFTKDFNTGIYPYSMMLSTFFPLENKKHSLKVSASIQEWCGHTYMELKNKKKFEVNIHSYFEGESIKEEKIDKDYLEDDFWTMIRLNPDNLPTGTQKVIPSFFYLRLMHEDVKAYTCELSLEEKDGVSFYQMNYPDLERKLQIQFNTDFPHQILSWNETYYSGFGEGKEQLTTSGILDQSIRTDYWNKNAVQDSIYRRELGLE